MKILFFLLCVTLISISVAYGESVWEPDDVIQKIKPTGAERTLGNHISSKSECTKQNGKWNEGKYPYCVLPYADAGKLCKNSKDCIGHCIMPLGGIALDGKPLPKGYGICQWDDEPDDCGRYHFENGKTIEFNCD